MQVLWEIVAGKAVEWLSCFVLVPTLYLASFRRLSKLRQAWDREARALSSSSLSVAQHHELGSVLPPGAGAGSGSGSGSGSRSGTGTRSGSGFGSTSGTKSTNSSATTPLVQQDTSPDMRPVHVAPASGSKRRVRLSSFNMKLLAVPLLFVLLRLWGSVRIFLGIADEGALARHGGWLLTLQAIGDPGQGWASALLFVVFGE